MADSLGMWSNTPPAQPGWEEGFHQAHFQKASLLPQQEVVEVHWPGANASPAGLFLPGKSGLYSYSESDSWLLGDRYFICDWISYAGNN